MVAGYVGEVEGAMEEDGYRQRQPELAEAVNASFVDSCKTLISHIDGAQWEDRPVRRLPAAFRLTGS
jgi:hypothetical protein